MPKVNAGEGAASILTEMMERNGVPDLAPRAESLWRGPSDLGPNGGITFSALQRFLECRERFRVVMCLGLKGRENFSHRMEYGNMWHVCEEALSAKRDWREALKNYCVKLTQKYPMSGQEIAHWRDVCGIQFVIYIEHWKKHPDMTRQKTLLEEQVFDVPYRLPSGRVVRLRGKWDGVVLVGE